MRLKGPPRDAWFGMWSLLLAPKSTLALEEEFGLWSDSLTRRVEV